jgi:uncharacterized protein (TIGR02594 family)
MKAARKGDKGSHITKIQIALNRNLKPSPYLIADGHFAQKTFDALKRFQLQAKLTSDGIAGDKTKKALGLDAAVKSVAKTPNVIAPWLDVALAEKGVEEIKGKGLHNKRIVEYHSTTTLGAKTDEVPWCSSFVNWVMIQSGYKGTNNALAKSWANWGAPVAKPFPGAITIIKRKSKNCDVSTGSATGYHVAFFVSLDSTKIKLVGENQGDKVKESGYMLRSYDIVGYRRPFPKFIGFPLNGKRFINYA